MIAKVGLGLIGLSAISVGGVALTKPYWLGMADPMPEYHTLDKDNGYDTTYSGDDKFGKKYGKYLVGVTKTNNKTDKNQKFWEWAFRQMSKEIEKSKFSTKGPNKKIDKGFSDTNNDTALNQVCKEAYKKKEDEFHSGTTGNDNGEKFTKDEVWEYCSPMRQKPKTIQESKNSNEPTGETIGKAAESELISVLDEGNKIFWEIRDKEFKDKDLTSAESSKFFSAGKTSGTQIKDLCSQAYTQPTTNTDDTGKATSEGTKKYCSLTFSA